jgi:hypothetical protein
MTRDPTDLLVRAQNFLLWKRRGVRLADQREWDDLTDAVNLLEKCLKELEELLTIFFDGTEEQLQAEVKKFKKEFLAMDVEQIAFPKGVSEVSKWTGPDGQVALPPGTKAVPIHCRASVVYNRMLSKFPSIHGVYAPIKNKSKIKYVYLKVPNPALDYTIAWESELPKEFDLHRYIDWDTMFEKTFAGPMQSLAVLLDWNIVKTEKLDDLFE